MIIDAHAHIGHGQYKSLSVESLLEQMDRNEIDRAVVCPVEEQIVLHNREGNDLLLSAVRRFPDRLVGFATVNPWYGQGAVEELRRALGEGLKGLKLHPVIQGFSLNDPIAYPVVEAAAQAGAPVYAHSGTAHFGEPFKLAELARRYPDIPFIMGHAGASDFWYDIPRCRQLAPNLVFETSRNGPANYTHMLLTMGAGAIVFGSNLPESKYELELASLQDAVLDPEDRAGIEGLNMARVLGGLA